MEKVTYFFSKHFNTRITLYLSDEVQILIQQKAVQYGVTPQQIVDDAGASLTSVGANVDCEKVIEDYVRSL